MSAPISGAREGRASWLRRLVARAGARDLRAFVVPGPEVARALGVDLEAAGLELSDTPRHAGVLVLVGELPGGLGNAAAVAYAQMPRPRAILAIGTGDVLPLPGPDAAVGFDGGTISVGELAAGVLALRRSFAEGAFAEAVADFDVDAVRTKAEYVCPMHPDVVDDEPGSCPRCGMGLVPREAAGDMDHGGTAHGGAQEHQGHNGATQERRGQVGAQTDAEGGGLATGYTCPMHPEVVQNEPGSCPVCGMNLVPREEAVGDPTAHDHAGMRHDPEAGHGSPDGTDHEDNDHDDSLEEQEHGADEGTEHGHMDHGDMGFMSMVEMTRYLPRGSDGLQMERIEAPFGPLFPGLPAGLSLRITLDGDTVAETEADGESKPAPEDVTGSAGTFAGRLARLDPLSPVAYRLLALRAVEEAAGIAIDEREALARVGALERERAASHLNWAASFAHLLGYAWLERRAVRLQLGLLRAADAEEAARLRPGVLKLARRVDRTSLLGRKLRGLGSLPGNAPALGPVARARGERVDARLEEGVYRDLLGFEPVVREGDDAFSRLLVRLEESVRSLELVHGAGSVTLPARAFDGAYPDGTGAATVETPRGPATLRVMLEGGEVRHFGLEAPSARHLGLVGTVTEGEELGNALVGVGSLDLSPWSVSWGAPRGPAR